MMVERGAIVPAVLVTAGVLMLLAGGADAADSRAAVVQKRLAALTPREVAKHTLDAMKTTVEAGHGTMVKASEKTEEHQHRRLDDSTNELAAIMYYTSDSCHNAVQGFVAHTDQCHPTDNNRSLIVSCDDDSVFMEEYYTTTNCEGPANSLEASLNYCFWHDWADDIVGEPHWDDDAVTFIEGHKFTCGLPNDYHIVAAFDCNTTSGEQVGYTGAVLPIDSCYETPSGTSESWSFEGDPWGSGDIVFNAYDDAECENWDDNDYLFSVNTCTEGSEATGDGNGTLWLHSEYLRASYGDDSWDDAAPTGPTTSLIALLASLTVLLFVH